MTKYSSFEDWVVATFQYDSPLGVALRDKKKVTAQEIALDASTLHSAFSKSQRLGDLRKAADVPHIKALMLKALDAQELKELKCHRVKLHGRNKPVSEVLPSEWKHVLDDRPDVTFIRNVVNVLDMEGRDQLFGLVADAAPPTSENVPMNGHKGNRFLRTLRRAGSSLGPWATDPLAKLQSLQK